MKQIFYYVLSTDVDTFEPFPDFIPMEKWDAVHDAIDARKGLIKSLSGDDILMYPQSDAKAWAIKFIDALKGLL